MIELTSHQPILATQTAPRTSALPVRVLILDDDPNIVNMLVHLLSGQEFEVMRAHSTREAASILNSTVPDVAIVDVHLGPEDGLAYVRDLRSHIPDLGIIVISSEDTALLAKQAVESGADDFLPKPFSPDELILKIRKLGELRQQRRRISELEKQLQRSVRESIFPEIVSHGDSMKAILRLVEKIGPRDLSVLVCGESGTGKELVARAIHNLSPRNRGQFVELNCAALPPNLVESELFGHERGAFTGAIAARTGKIEQASGGTLFLDEIGELPLEIQPKFLRALQEKRVTRVGGKESIDCDFRLITATNRDLMEEVQAGRFREDLFFRIAVFPIKLPALRERPEDIDLLLMHFLHKEGMSHVQISSDARDMLISYAWPGNVRELRNFAQAATLLTQNGMIDDEAVRSYFGTRLESNRVSHYHASMHQESLLLAQTAAERAIRKLADVEREEILHALRLLKGDVPEAARELGMGRATLYKYVNRHGIDLKSFEA